MSIQNIQLAKMAVENLSVRDRAALLRELTDQPEPREPDRLLPTRVAADRLGKTPRTIFNLLKTGVLTRVKLPGRRRGCGIRESEIAHLINGNERLTAGEVL